MASAWRKFKTKAEIIAYVEEQEFIAQAATSARKKNKAMSEAKLARMLAESWKDR